MKKSHLFFTLIFYTFGSFAQTGSNTGFVPEGRVFGEVFGDYYYKVASDTLFESTGGEYQKNAKDDNAFALRRFYLGYEYQFSEKISVKLMLEGNDEQLLDNGIKSANLKYYYVKWKNIFPGSDLMIGGQSTPTWCSITEKTWGYRSVEKTIMDFRKAGCSNDFGISLSGKLNKDQTIAYNLMIGNGTGQKPENNIFKKLYASVNGKFFDKKLLVELYTDLEKTSETSSKQSIKGFVGFQNSKLTIGVEPFQQITREDNMDDVVTFGSTFFVRGQLVENKLRAFGRFDLFNPDDTKSLYDENFSLIGLDYTPHSNIHIIPNIWLNGYSEMDGAMARTSDVTARLTFWVKF